MWMCLLQAHERLQRSSLLQRARPGTHAHSLQCACLPACLRMRWPPANQDEVLAQLSDLASWKTSRLLSVDAASSHVVCHFDEGLVATLRQARQLAALGCAVRREVMAEVDNAAQFHRCAPCLSAERVPAGAGSAPVPAAFVRGPSACCKAACGPSAGCLGASLHVIGAPPAAAGTGWCCSAARTFTTASAPR